MIPRGLLCAFLLSLLVATLGPIAPNAAAQESAAKSGAAVTPESVGFSSERLERLQTAMHHEVDDNKSMAGVVTLLMRHGKLVELNGAADTWFWVDPTNDIVFIGMTQHQIGPRQPNVEQISRPAVYQALVDPKK